jgi:putative transposase
MVSYGKKALGVSNRVVDLNWVYKALGKNAEERRTAHQDYVFQTIPKEELKLIRDSIKRNQVTGGDRFRQQLEWKHKIRLSHRGPGRPKKVKK